MTTSEQAEVTHVIGTKGLFEGERCDIRRCTIEARLQLILGNGDALWFCGHHANLQAEGLIKAAESVVIHPDFVNWRAYGAVVVSS